MCHIPRHPHDQRTQRPLPPRSLLKSQPDRQAPRAATPATTNLSPATPPIVVSFQSKNPPHKPQSGSRRPPDATTPSHGSTNGLAGKGVGHPVPHSRHTTTTAPTRNRTELGVVFWTGTGGDGHVYDKSGGGGEHRRAEGFTQIHLHLK